MESFITEQLKLETIESLNSLQYGDNREKSVELLIYPIIKTYLDKWLKDILSKQGLITLTAPHQTDCLLTVKTFDYTKTVLLEAKYDKDHSKLELLHETLAQCVYYLKRFKEEDLIPAAVVIVNKTGLQIFDTKDLLFVINGDYPDIAPSSALFESKELLKDLEVLSPKYVSLDFSMAVDWGKSLAALTHILENSEFSLTKSKGHSLPEFKRKSLITLIEEVASNIKDQYAFNPLLNSWYRLNTDESWSYSKESAVYSKAIRVFCSLNDLSFYDSSNLLTPQFQSFLLEDLKSILSNTDAKESKTSLKDREREIFNDLMLSFCNERLNFDKTTDSFITLEDMLAAFNEYVTAKGNASYSQRLFVESFTNHSVYKSSGVVYKRGAFVKKDYVRSCFKPLRGNEYIPAPLKSRVSYFFGVSFN